VQNLLTASLPSKKRHGGDWQQHVCRQTPLIMVTGVNRDGKPTFLRCVAFAPLVM